jgi:hypothetical protein
MNGQTEIMLLRHLFEHGAPNARQRNIGRLAAALLAYVMP